MKKEREYSVSKKTVTAFIIMAVLLIPISIVMALAGMRLTRNRENAQNELKMNVLSKLVANESDMLEVAGEQFDRNLSANLMMVTTSLKEFVTEDEYTGPRVLTNGFVVELREGAVVLPEGMPKGRMALTQSLIEQSVASGKMRTGRYFADEAVTEATPLSGDAAKAADDSGATLPDRSFFLSFGQITDDLFYVELTAEARFEEEVSSYFAKNNTAVGNENGSFGGITLLISEEDDGVELLRSYGDAGSVESLSELGITAEQIKQRSPILVVNGTTYSCTYSTLQEAWGERENPVMIQMLPIAAIGMRSVVQSAIICYAMALILFNLIVYVMSVQRYVREHTLTEEQAARYNPRRLRMRVTNAGVIGILAILVSSVIVLGVGQLYIELRNGRDTLRVFSKQLEQVDQYQTEALERNQENWYVYYGEQMASLLSTQPSLATPEMLQKYCDILSVDFIMLFDNQGNETLCNRDYAGFTLNRGLGNNSDFRRLLYGMPSIVQEVSTDSITGLERQMIGVKLPATDNVTKHGALVMALLPDQTKQTAEMSRFDERSALFAMSGTRCFTADAVTGVIQHGSDAEMVGQTVVECGLSEKSLQDGYMDFDVVDGTRCFVVTSKYDGSIYYYALELSRMVDKVLLYGAMATLLFALATIVVLVYLLAGYTDEVYAQWAVVCMPADQLRGTLRKRREKARHDSGDAADTDDAGKRKRGRIRAFAEKVAEFVHWNSRMPEEKTSLVFKVSLLILLVSWTSLLLSKNIVYNKFDSFAGFLLQGDWMRGANLFSFCSILLIIAYAYLINMVSRALLLMVSGFLLGKGQTFCRLLHSFIKYFSLFVVLYLILHYLGFPIGTVVGSLSITTLALSLGAKDLAADILAGLSIVFERTFQVGDIVEINGNRGKVQEIGVRSTKLIVPVNNVLVISNHEIRDVLNLTQDISLHTVDIRLLLSGALTELEDILNRELPLIAKKNDRIISLEYLGVTALGNKSDSSRTMVVTLGIGAYCQEDDADDVMVFLNREMWLLSERERFSII